MASKAEIDVFSAVKNVSHFLRNRMLLEKSTEAKVKLFTINSLLALEAIQRYRNIVFVLGNSDHHIEVFKALEELCSLGMEDRVTVYLHDPCCHNIIEKGKNLTSRGYAEYISSLEKRILPLKDVANDGAPWLVHAAAIKNDIFGVRALTQIGVRKFIVNSQAAEDMIIKELGEDVKFVQVKKIYHPAFEPCAEAHVIKDERKSTERIITTIGTFGGAGYSKHTDVVLEICQKLRSKNSNIELIIAGYGSEKYLNEHFMGNIPQWVHHFQPKTDEGMQQLMARCDLALQLRRESLGESSGVVPLLLKLEVPTIVSGIGAFLEYEDAVTVAPENTVEAILSIIKEGEFASVESMRSYTDKRAVENFEREFRKLLR
jgi:glycosyltransferase involved in cell wall biosynthesis